MVNLGPTTDHKKVETEMLITDESWRKHKAHVKGPFGKIKAVCRQSK